MNAALLSHDYDILLLIAGGLVVIAAIVVLVLRQDRCQLGALLVGSIASSVAIYLVPASRLGQEEFQERLLFALVVAISIALGTSALKRDWDNVVIRLVITVAGVAAPPTLLMLLIVVPCIGVEDCYV